ncbi:MAG: hypothetical protein K8R90_03900 [Candidatus Cloacimonetes bacterium]|nr:hypothetical protein [Candidatus Cloacimonadota bacterium]
MKKPLLLLLVLCLAVPVIAQTVSVRRAVLFSAMLPGTGELYSHSYNKGAMFLGAEMAILFTWWRLQQERQWKIDSYQAFASQYAGVPKGSDDNVYRRLQSYYSNEDYNAGIIRDARNYFLIYKNDPEAYEEYVSANIYSGDDAWQWQTHSKWYEFQTLRNEKQNLEIYAKFALGAALINRIVSIIDAARTARGYNEQALLNGTISVQPDWHKMGFFINYEYSF